MNSGPNEVSAPQELLAMGLKWIALVARSSKGMRIEA
jgi:hypothetical protein